MKQTEESADSPLIAVAKTIGSTVGTVVGALGIAPEKSAKPEVPAPPKQTFSHLPRRQKKAAKKAALLGSRNSHAK